MICVDNIYIFTNINSIYENNKINMYLESWSYIVNTYSHINMTIWAPYMLTYIPQYMESGNSLCIIQYIVIYYHNVLLYNYQYTENTLIYWLFIESNILFP